MVEINNLTSHLINQGFLKKIVAEVLKKEGKEKEDLSIALVGQARIRKLNKKYRGKNRVTDILSFPQKEPGKLGEIVMCLREIKKNAKKFNSTFEKELASCLIHGILHLLGYEHEKSEKRAKEMEKNLELRNG